MLGSKFVGSAVFCPDLNIRLQKSIALQASAFTAECVDLNDALDTALNHSNLNFLIFTDSLSALQSLKSSTFGIKTNNYILNIKKKYNQFALSNTNSNDCNNFIKFYWIPSHSKILGNETADNLAKNATTMCTLDIRRIPFTNFTESFKKRAALHTAKIIKNQGLYKGKFFFRNYYSNSSTPWYKYKKLNRKFIVTINRSRAELTSVP
ncbi:hypothetical protein KPH14_012694 [Odynerus spinipes]|uniref:RNase H type-1 domain-containing protein n=1 Tax=Odynerus spinipes TaxID=1348599 RepID=A0AAD9RDN4_9HYME|nr:hypothetical protein KPH14_012694 [Odynerus spinipes]